MSSIDRRALIVVGEHGKAAYEESFPASLDWALGRRTAARAAYDHEAARSVLQEYADLRPDLPEAPPPRSGRRQVASPDPGRDRLLYFAVELATAQYVVGSCEAFHH